MRQKSFLPNANKNALVIYGDKGKSNTTTPDLFEPSREFRRRFEGRNVVFRDDNSRVFRNVAGFLRLPVLPEKSAESAQIDILATDERFAHLLHEVFHDSRYRFGFDARLQGDLFYKFCFSHLYLLLCVVLSVCESVAQIHPLMEDTHDLDSVV